MLIVRKKLFELLREMTNEGKIPVETHLILRNELIEKFEELLPPER